MARLGGKMARKKRSRARRRAQNGEAREKPRREEATAVVQAADLRQENWQLVADSRKASNTANRYRQRSDDVTTTFGTKAYPSNLMPSSSTSPAPEGPSGGCEYRDSHTDCADASLSIASPFHKERQACPKASERVGHGDRFSCSEQGEGGGGVSRSSTNSSVGWDDYGNDCDGYEMLGTSASCGSKAGMGNSVHQRKYLVEGEFSGFNHGKGGASSAGSTAEGGGWDGYDSIGISQGSAGTSTSSRDGGVPWESNSYESGGGEESAMTTRSMVEEVRNIIRDDAFSTVSVGDATGLTSWSTDGHSGGEDGEGDSGNESNVGGEALLWNATTVAEDGWTARTIPEEATNTLHSAALIVRDLCEGRAVDGDQGMPEGVSGRPSCWEMSMAEGAATVQGETTPIDDADASIDGTLSQSINDLTTATAAPAVVFGKGAQSIALKGLLGLAPSLPSQASAAPGVAIAPAPSETVARIQPSFGETPTSKVLKGLLGLNASPLWQPAVAATTEAEVIASCFGEGESTAPKGQSGLAQPPPVQQVCEVMAEGFGETPSSKVLKGLLRLSPSPPSQLELAAAPVSEEPKEVLNSEDTTRINPSSEMGGAHTTGAPADPGWEPTAASQALKGLLGIGESLVGLGSDEVDITASQSELIAGASATVPAAMAINVGGGAATLRPPPGFGTALQLSPWPATLENGAIDMEGDVAPLRIPPGFEATPQLPPSAMTGGDDAHVFRASAGTDTHFPLQPSPPRRCGAPPGFEPSSVLQQQNAKGMADMIFRSDFAILPQKNSEIDKHDDNFSSTFNSNFQDFDALGVNGRFGFVSGLASLDERRVTLGRRLGQGGCAVVYKLEVVGADRRRAVAEYTGVAELVVKMVPQGGSQAQKKSMMRELRVVQKIPPNCHKNIMNIFSMSDEKLSMIMPAAVCDLRDLLENKDVLSSMSFAARMMMLAGAARGLHHLHSELGLTHGDVKPENCLLGKGLVIQIADFGLSGSSQEAIGGLTKQYAAPEAVAAFQRQEIPQRTKLEPSLDIYSFGVMVPQILFMEKEARFDGKELATHGMTPKHPSFDAAFKNSLELYEQFEVTGSLQDQQRLEDANAAMVDLHIDYAAQPAKMGDLRSTILDPEKWIQPEELFFQEEVTLTLLSLLNKNPHRRASLDTVAGLLECPALWAPTAAPGGAAATSCDNVNDDGGDDGYRCPYLPQDVRDTIGRTIGVGLLIDPALDTPSGVWWEAPEFQFPWWNNPPPVERIVL